MTDRPQNRAILSDDRPLSFDKISCDKNRTMCLVNFSHHIFSTEEQTF